MMRILLFGDGAWAADSLRRLAKDGWDIAGVVIRVRPSDTSLVEAAGELGFPVLQPQQVNRPEFVSQVTAMHPDLNVSISYDQILRRPILESAPLGFINFHAGRLPCYRGRNVINWAIINGENEIGLTAHYIDTGIDTGDIVLQRTLPICWTDTYSDVLRKLVAAFPELVTDTVRLIARGQAEPQPQAHLPGTYFSSREEGDEWLDWSDTSRIIYNKVRAITRPGPGARTMLDDQAIVIWRAFYDPQWPAYIATPGQVVGRRSREGVFVKTGDSTLLVQEVQAEHGAPEMPAWRIGTRLGTNLSSYLRQLEARVRDLERQMESANR